MRLLHVLVVVGLSAPAVAIGEAPSRTIQVSAEATQSFPADRVTVDIGVVTRSEKSADAARENARQAQRVHEAVREELGRGANIETVGYTLHPDYQHTTDDSSSPPRIVAYTARNTVRVTVDDTAAIGATIDAATRAGANQVERIQFRLRDERAARRTVLDAAAREARARAEQLASSLDLCVVGIVSATETAPPRAPIREMAIARAAPATPITGGTIELDANITLTVEVEPRAAAECP